jgi:phage regulator Rha-like protein
MSALEVFTHGATLVISSETVAEGSGVEHRAVLQLITNNIADFEEFGQVAFQMRAGYNNAQVRVALLNEQQATLLMTYQRNTDEVRKFKKSLVRAFFEMAQKPALTNDQIVQQALTIMVARTAQLEAKVQELAPSAEAWDELASATGDYSVGESSKILARAGVETGPNRLFAQLADLNWIFRDGHYVWTAYASAVDNGYVTLKPASHPHPRTGERIVDPPQVRITVKGLDRLRVRLGALVLT